MRHRPPQNLYDELDPLYRALWGTSLHHGLFLNQKESPERARENLIEALLGENLPQGTIADIGCGYGVLAHFLLDHSSCQVIANTHSRKQADRIPRRPGLTVHCDSWLELELSPASLDAALAIESFSHFPSFDAVLSHSAKALKPGGLLHVADWFSDSGDSPLLRHLARVGGLPPWRSLQSLTKSAKNRGLTMVRSRDLSTGVAPTWSHLFHRALRCPLASPSHLPALVSGALRHPPLLWAFPLIRLAYQTGDLEYHLVTLQKSAGQK